MRKIYLVLFLSILNATSFSQYPPTYYLSGFNKVADPIADISIWRHAETNPFQRECNSAWIGCTPYLYDNSVLPNQQCWPDTMWIAAGKTVSIRTMEGFRGTLIIPQGATLIIEYGQIGDTDPLGAFICISQRYREGELTAAFINPNGKIIVAGTLINKKKLDIYGMMHITSTGQYIQDNDSASLNFYSFNSHSIYRQSIQSDTMVDNSPYLKIDAPLTQFKKGKLTFNDCKLGNNASLIEFGATGSIYTDSISDLNVIINNNLITNQPYPTQDGYKISGPNQRNFHVGKFELTGTAKVSMKPVALTCTEMKLNPDTEFRADGTTGYWTRFDVYKNVINNGTLIVSAISWVNHPSQRSESIPYSISGTGSFRNKIVQASATASFSNLSFSTFNLRGIDIKTPISVANNSVFQNDSIKVNLMSDVLYGFEPTHNSLYPNSRVVCDGTGSLLLKRTLNSTYSSTIAIGTANFSTPLKISQVGNNSADTFRIRALPLTNALDATQCFPVMWEIKESTSGGNLGFAAAPILYNKYFSSQFSAPVMRLYEKKNSSWSQKNTVYTVSNSTALNYWEFNIATQVGNFLGKDTLGVASGTGLLSGTPLSVKWFAFTAKIEKQKAILNWQVQEDDVKEYTVQKAINNSNYINIKTIVSKGNGINTYMYNDADALNETTYYRIMQIDNDGKYSFSKLLTLKTTVKSEILKLYPNPVKEILFAQITSAKTEKVTLQITDMQGKVLQQQQVLLQFGSTNASINTAALAKGSYLLLIKGDVLQQKQFIKQ